MDEITLYAGSREPLPTKATVDGQPAASHKVALQSFEFGLPSPPAPDSDEWVDAPLLLDAQPKGYYCIFTLVEQGQVAAISHAGHLRLL